MVFGKLRRTGSPLDFHDGDDIPLTPNAVPPSRGGSNISGPDALAPRFARFAGVPHRGPVSPSVPNFPAHLRRNKSERQRLQGLMGGGRASSVLPTNAVRGAAEVDPLSRGPSSASNSTATSGTNELSKSDLRTGVAKDSLRHRVKIWMLNEGGRKMFLWTWILVHLLVFAFGCASILLP